MQPFGLVPELHKVLEILKGRVSTPAFDIPHKGRAVYRRHHQLIAANLNAARRITCVLRERRRGGRTELACKAFRDPHALTLNVCACVSPAFQRLWVVHEGHTDLLQHAIGVRFNNFESFVVQDLQIRDPTFDDRRHIIVKPGPFSPATCASTTACPATCSNLSHRNPSS